MPRTSSPLGPQGPQWTPPGPDHRPISTDHQDAENIHASYRYVEDFLRPRLSRLPVPQAPGRAHQRHARRPRHDPRGRGPDRRRHLGPGHRRGPQPLLRNPPTSTASSRTASTPRLASSASPTTWTPPTSTGRWPSGPRPFGTACTSPTPAAGYAARPSTPSMAAAWCRSTATATASSRRRRPPRRIRPLRCALPSGLSARRSFERWSNGSTRATPTSAVGDHTSRHFLNGARRLHFFQR